MITETELSSIIAVLGPIINAAGAILLIVLGFILNEWSTRRREQDTSRRQAETARTLISIEIGQNLASLQQFWNQVKRTDSEETTEPGSFDLAVAFVQVPIAPFKQTAFTNQMPLLASRLKEPARKEVFGVYDRLARLETIRRDLLAAKAKQEDGILTTRTSDAIEGLRYVIQDVRDAVETIAGKKPDRLEMAPPIPIYDPFMDKLRAANGEWQSLVEQLLALGNPLEVNP